MLSNNVDELIVCALYFSQQPIHETFCRSRGFFVCIFFTCSDVEVEIFRIFTERKLRVFELKDIVMLGHMRECVIVKNI